MLKVILGIYIFGYHIRWKLEATYMYVSKTSIDQLISTFLKKYIRYYCECTCTVVNYDEIQYRSDPT